MWTVETPNENALVAQDVFGGYDWSLPSKEEHPTTLLYRHIILLMFLPVQIRSLLESQVSDKFKTGLGYNAATAASPAVECFVNSSKIDFEKDMSNHESAGVKNNGDAVEPKTIRENNFIPPIIEDWNSDDESEINYTVGSSIEKIRFVKPSRETIEKVETPKQNKHYPRGNQRNWNNLMSQRLGSDFKMINKACYVCGSFEHLHYVCDKKVIRPVWNNSRRVNHKNFANKMTHPHSNRGFVPQAVLTRTGKINTAGAKVNTAVRPVNTVGSKPTVNHPRPISNAYKKGYSQVTRSVNKFSANKNSIFNKKVNTVRVKDTTARDRAVVSENKGKGANVVKASACWVWKAKNSSNPQQKEYKEKGVIDSGYSSAIHDCSSLYDSNGVAERKNRTLIKATRTMLVDSKLPTTFWAEAVNTACYVLNKVLVIKPHNKTPYELICGRPPLIDFMKPFGCHVTILNTRDHLGKFDEKADEGYFVGYSVISKAMRVFNKRTRIVEETLNIRFFKNVPNVKGNGPDWLFDVDSLSKSMNYVPVVAGNQTNGIAGTKDNIVASQAQKKKEHEQEYILVPFCTTDPLISQDPKDSEEDAGMKPTEVNESGASDKGKEDDQDTRSEFERLLQQENQTEHPNNTNIINTVSTPVSTVGPSLDNTVGTIDSTANAFKEHLFA
ncbi:ribonuclease H-like domain-containing protein [Tanacetum coccineum]|uniref:Ribonuclease H-like domain-containing protein n=1 Tax=Tanacetum coccineum TaxID=301880 RepID=A0ABQ4WS76_9ASTR